MAILKPAAAKTFGRESWVFVPAVADKTAPTVAEITAAGALDLTGFVFAESSSGVTINTNVVQTARRVYETVQSEFVGVSNYTMGEMRYALDPQAASGSDAKKAYETLPEGTQGFLVHRLSVDPDDAFASGQFVTVIPTDFGPQNIASSTTDASAEAQVTQTVAVRDTPAFLVEVAA